MESNAKFLFMHFKCLFFILKMNLHASVIHFCIRNLLLILILINTLLINNNLICISKETVNKDYDL